MWPRTRPARPLLELRCSAARPWAQHSRFGAAPTGAGLRPVPGGPASCRLQRKWGSHAHKLWLGGAQDGGVPDRLRRFEGRHPEHWVPRFVETGPRRGPGTGGPSAPPQPTERGERGHSLLVGACGAVLRVAPGGHLAWLWGSRPRRLPGARLPASPATVETVVSGCGFLVEACGHRRAPSVCDGVSGTPSPPWVGSRPSGEGHEGALREQPHPGSAPAPAAGTCRDRDRCCVQPGARPPRAPPPDRPAQC